MRLVDWSISVSEHIGVVCHATKKKCTIDVNRMASVGNKICKNVLFCASKPIKLAQLVLQEFLSQEKKVVHVISVLQHVIAGQNV